MGNTTTKPLIASKFELDDTDWGFIVNDSVKIDKDILNFTFKKGQAIIANSGYLMSKNSKVKILPLDTVFKNDTNVIALTPVVSSIDNTPTPVVSSIDNTPSPIVSTIDDNNKYNSNDDNGTTVVPVPKNAVATVGGKKQKGGAAATTNMNVILEIFYGLEDDANIKFSPSIIGEIKQVKLEKGDSFNLFNLGTLVAFTKGLTFTMASNTKWYSLLNIENSKLSFNTFLNETENEHFIWFIGYGSIEENDGEDLIVNISNFIGINGEIPDYKVIKNGTETPSLLTDTGVYIKFENTSKIYTQTKNVGNLYSMGASFIESYRSLYTNLPSDGIIYKQPIIQQGGNIFPHHHGRVKPQLNYRVTDDDLRRLSNFIS